MPLKTLQKLPTKEGLGLFIALRSDGSLTLTAEETRELCQILPKMFPDYFVMEALAEDISAIAQEAFKR